MTGEMMNSGKHAILTLALAVTMTACQKTEEVQVQEPVAAGSVASKPMPDLSGASPGKPSAPISMRYEIMSNPVVGQAVQINVSVTSAEGPVDVRYSITDRSALQFQQGQVESLEIADPSTGAVQQLSVVPMREGRLYVTVSAEVQAPGGSMIRSMSIPIKVGAAPAEATPNGEVVEGPDGQTVISLPAQESNENPNRD